MFNARRLSLPLLAAGLAAVTAAGCGTVAATSSGPASGNVTGAGSAVAAVGSVSSAASPRPRLAPSSPARSPQGVNVAAFDALARQEAAAWARSRLARPWTAGLVVLDPGSLSAGPSGGFPTSAAKLSFVNGDLVFTGQAPTAAPAGTVTWAGGSSMKVPVLSAAQAFRAMQGSGCGGCSGAPLDVTAARPTTLRIATSRGTATVPAWAFTLHGVSTPAVQAALPPSSYHTLAELFGPAEPLGPLGPSFVGAEVIRPASDARSLVIVLFRSPCDATWGGLVSEVGGVVVIGGWAHNPHPGAACPASLATAVATVHLTAPLGSRVIVDASTGHPATYYPSAAS